MKKLLICFTLIMLALVNAFAMPKQDKTPEISLRVSALVGPSGIGMAPMFANPPIIPGIAETTFEAAPSVDALIPKLIKGEVDIGILPPNVAAKINSLHPESFLVCAVVGNGMLSVVTTDQSLTSPAGLKEKKVVVAGQGSTPEYVFRTLLDYHNIEKNVTLDFSLPTPEIAAALISGKIDYAVLPEPFATVAVMNGKKAGVQVRRGWSLVDGWREAGYGSDFPMTLCVVRKDIFESHPDAVRVFLAEYRKSIEWVLRNPQEAGPLVEAAGLGLKAQIAEQAIPVCNFVFIPAHEAQEQIEGLLSVFLKFSPDSIGGKLPEDAFYLK